MVRQKVRSQFLPLVKKKNHIERQKVRIQFLLFKKKKNKIKQKQKTITKTKQIKTNKHSKVKGKNYILTFEKITW